MATPYEHAHYMAKWLIRHTHSQKRWTHPQFNHCPDNTKLACHLHVHPSHDFTMAAPYEHAHYMTKWLIRHTHSQNTLYTYTPTHKTRCTRTYPQSNRYPDNTKRACHRRARSKTQWIYTWTKASSRELAQENRKKERKKERNKERKNHKWPFFWTSDSGIYNWVDEWSWSC